MAEIWIPGGRFIELLDSRGIEPFELGDSGKRRMHDLRSGRQEAISLAAADRILTRVGLPHWVHILADDYKDYQPSWVKASRKQLDSMREQRRKYRTEQERIEGHRASARRSQEKKKTPCVDCGKKSLGERCQACRNKHVETPHGAISRYSRYGCRCDVCRSAMSAYHRERRQRMRDAQLAVSA